MKAAGLIQSGLGSSLEMPPKQEAVAGVDSTNSVKYPEPSSKTLTEADYRLVIERNPNTGSYIYKTLNAFTGEVVSQRPAEAVLKMGDSLSYLPGSMVNSKV